jgi:hypothetical protein
MKQRFMFSLFAVLLAFTAMAFTPPLVVDNVDSGVTVEQPVQSPVAVVNVVFEVSEDSPALLRPPRSPDKVSELSELDLFIVTQATHPKNRRNNSATSGGLSFKQLSTGMSGEYAANKYIVPNVNYFFVHIHPGEA